MIRITHETLPRFQEFLAQQDVDAWLLYDFHDLNPFSRQFAGLEAGNITRRWFYFLPAQGTPQIIAHRIEENYFQDLPGNLILYSGWKELEAKLTGLLKDSHKITMEYSPGAALPYVSRIDAGTMELIRSLGVEVVSSGDIIQYFHSRWTQQGYELHKGTVPIMHRIREQAFRAIAQAIKADQPVNEYVIQQQMLREFEQTELVTDHAPIVAVNAHAAMPHYAPTEDTHDPIRKGDLVLIDMWARQDHPEATYVDITWTGFVGEQVPAKIASVFDIVKRARDTAVELIQSRLAAGEPVTGMEVDNACRAVIEAAGYGQYFTHRTGHSIDVDVHGAGVNIDALEVRDDRKLIPNVGFSIEPGIYLTGEFGIRSEIDCFITELGVEVTTGPTQEEVLPLLTMF